MPQVERRKNSDGMSLGLCCQGGCSTSNRYDEAVTLGYAENDIRKKLEEISKESRSKKKGRETRTQRVLDPDLDAGSEF